MSDSSQHDVVPETPKKTSVVAGAPAPPSPVPPKFNSTPIFRKLSGNPNAKKSLTHVYMDPALKEELFESQLLDVPGFVEHFFPDTLFPVPFATLEAAILKKHWSTRLKDWKDYNTLSIVTSAADQKPGVAETTLAGFFNSLGETLVRTCRYADRSYQPFANRHWVTKSETPMHGGPQARRKPDVCLVEKGQEPTWMSTLITAELKSNASHANKALMQLTNSAYMIFSTQDERRFHIGVSVCHADVRVYMFDRSGIVGSKSFHFSKESALLIRLLAGLILTDPDAIGLDTTIHHHGDGTRSVIVADLEYQLVKTLFINDSIRGRGTVCWQARREDADYVIKNTWTDVARMRTEADVMRMVSDVEGIAHLIGEEIVQHNSAADSTAGVRSIIGSLTKYDWKDWYNKLEVRVHRRLVTTPVAEGLTHFKSKKELLTVLICAIEAHARLVEKHILHRDISIANVMIHRPPPTTALKEQEADSHFSTTLADTVVAETTPPTSSDNSQTKASAKGILIDLDYALITHDESGEKTKRELDATGHRTGTLPFMAIDILMGLGAGEEHQAHHDLESFFYILLWIMLQYAGPGDIERQDVNIESLGRIKGWTQGSDIVEIGMNKAHSMTTSVPALFHKSVASLCTPYFKDLTPCIEELRQRLFITVIRDGKPTHQDIITILRKALVKLPDDDNWSRENDKDGYGPVGGHKRKLETRQEETEDQDESHLESPLEARRKRAKTAPSLREYRTPSRKSARIQSMVSLRH